MATNITFQLCRQSRDARTGIAQSAALSMADVTVNTNPNSSGGFNTAVVTADKQVAINLVPADAATCGLEPGWYQNIGGAVFRRDVA